jgi:hypothetical protein
MKGRFVLALSDSNAALSVVSGDYNAVAVPAPTANQAPPRPARGEKKGLSLRVTHCQKLREAPGSSTPRADAISTPLSLFAVERIWPPCRLPNV